MDQDEQVAFLAMLDTAYYSSEKRNSVAARISRRVIKLVKDPRRWLKIYWKEYSRRGRRLYRNRRNRRNKDRSETAESDSDPGQEWFAGAVRRYRAKPFTGRVSLVIATRGGEFGSGDPVERWADVALGGADLIRIEGGHFSILEEPAVRDLAAELRTVMDVRIENGF